MALVKVVKQSIRFNDSKGTVHEIAKGAALPYELPDEHLEHKWIKAHIAEGNSSYRSLPTRPTSHSAT